MDVYFLSIMIVGGIILLKLVIILCAYGCRLKRLREQNAQSDGVNNNGEQSYPAQEYSSRSPIVDFEETPQHIYRIQPGSEASTIPALVPPPYEVATGGVNFKPPTYEQAVSQTEINMCVNAPDDVPQSLATMDLSLLSTVQCNTAEVPAFPVEVPQTQGNPSM